MEPTYRVQLGEKPLTLFEVERLMLRHWDGTRSANALIFDALSLPWIGYYPAALLFSWIASLRAGHSSREVEFLIPPRDELSSQIEKTLLRTGLLHAIHTLGVLVPYHSAPQETTGLTFQLVACDQPTTADLEAVVYRVVQRFSDIDNREFRSDLQAVVAELLENALIHGDKKFPHLGASFSRSEGARRVTGVMRVFERGTDYAELVIGDIGGGINRRLANLLPEGYISPFFDPNHSYLKGEQVLSYGFEFDSTSDEVGRSRRVNRLLTDESIDAASIATGLFCTLGVVRSRKGQLIVRTPRDLLSLDFAIDSDRPIVKGRKQLGLTKLAPLPGTHFVLRIPLVKPRDRSSIHYLRQGAANVRDVEVCDLFADAQQSDDPGILLRRAISALSGVIKRKGERGGLLVVRAPHVYLSPRAREVFYLSVRSLLHGKVRIILINSSEGLNSSFAQESPQQPSTASQGSLLPYEQGVLIGDPISNKFNIMGVDGPPWWSDFTEKLPSKNLVGLLGDVRETILHKLKLFLVQKLTTILRDPEIRLAPGPFQIDHDHYREVFYHLTRALSEQIIQDPVVEWILVSFPEDVEVIILGAKKLEPIALRVINELRSHGFSEPSVIVHEPSMSMARSIAQALSCQGRKAIVLTDIICRGKAVRSVIEALAGISILKILTLIDARSIDEAGDLVVRGIGAEKRLIPVEAVLSEPIEYFRSLAALDMARPQREVSEEKVYVVDPIIATPTLHKRSIMPAMSMREVLGPISLESSSLFTAEHRSFGGKHYSVFLDFPRLFEAMRERIQAWVSDQLRFQQSNDSGAPLRFFLYDVPNGLQWLPVYLREVSPDARIETITWEQISAPAPVAESGKDFAGTIVLPAAESGEVARRCIEYVSRLLPQEILLLSVVSRMSPYHLNFMTGVTQYRYVPFRSAFFVDLPIRAYEPGFGNCPMCSEVADLIALFQAVKRRGVAPELTQCVRNRIILGREHAMEFDSGAETPPQTTAHDSARAVVRALYEAAEMDHRAQIDLGLELEGEAIERFLEVLSLERRSRHFALTELRRRLGDRFLLVRDHALEILRASEPPFPIGRIALALVHIVPMEFVAKSVSLLERFSFSERDVEDICIALLLVGAEPPRMLELVGRFRQRSEERTARLVAETVAHLHEGAERMAEIGAVQDGVDAFANFVGCLYRSGLFFSGCRNIGNAKWSSSMAGPAFIQECEAIVADWNERLARYLEKVYSAPFWRRFAVRHDVLHQMLERLEKDVAEAQHLIRSIFPRGEIKIRQCERLWQIVRQLDHDRKIVLGIARDLFVDPYKCNATAIEELRGRQGGNITVRKVVDWKAPEILCDLGSLNVAVGEIVDNWQKFAPADGANVWIDISNGDDGVMFDFEDDIREKYNRSSNGGVSRIEEMCLTYGGFFEFLDGKYGPRNKLLRLTFLRAPVEQPRDMREQRLAEIEP